MNLKRTFGVILLFLVISGFYLSCSRGDFATTIIGTVSDSLTGLPLEDAFVYLSDTVLTEPIHQTDSLGLYDLELLGYGPFKLFCLKTGYKSKIITIQGSDKAHYFDDVNFQLTKE